MFLIDQVIYSYNCSDSNWMSAVHLAAVQLCVYRCILHHGPGGIRALIITGPS